MTARLSGCLTVVLLLLLLLLLGWMVPRIVGATVQL